MAAATLCGFSAGEKDEKKLTQYALAICVIAVLLMGLMSTLLFFAPGMILSILPAMPAVIALGTRLLRIVAFSEPFFAAAIILEGVFNGVGDVKVPFAISLGHDVGRAHRVHVCGGAIPAFWACHRYGCVWWRTM